MLRGTLWFEKSTLCTQHFAKSWKSERLKTIGCFSRLWLRTIAVALKWTSVPSRPGHSWSKQIYPAWGKRSYDWRMHNLFITCVGNRDLLLSSVNLFIYLAKLNCALKWSSMGHFMPSYASIYLKCNWWTESNKHKHSDFSFTLKEGTFLVSTEVKWLLWIYCFFLVQVMEWGLSNLHFMAWVSVQMHEIDFCVIQQRYFISKAYILSNGTRRLPRMLSK
jgi:hypothetical protein